jgi:hypothetical protein
MKHSYFAFGTYRVKIYAPNSYSVLFNVFRFMSQSYQTNAGISTQIDHFAFTARRRTILSGLFLVVLDTGTGYAISYPYRCLIFNISVDHRPYATFIVNQYTLIINPRSLNCPAHLHVLKGNYWYHVSSIPPVLQLHHTNTILHYIFATRSQDGAVCIVTGVQKFVWWRLLFVT